MKILVETSARHVHLSEKDLYVLFGENYKLTSKKELSQPGQFACTEKVTIKGPKGEIAASILGPTRNKTQVELSFTDARKIGLVPPVKESGDHNGTPGCTLVGSCGEVVLNEGVIVAKRHIHLNPDKASEYGLIDKQIVNVKINSDNRSVILGDVVVRVSENFLPAMHIDTDEANAAGINGAIEGEILK